MGKSRRLTEAIVSRHMLRRSVAIWGTKRGHELQGSCSILASHIISVVYLGLWERRVCYWHSEVRLGMGLM